MNYAKLVADLQYALDMFREMPTPATEIGRACRAEAKFVLVNLQNKVMEDLEKIEVLKHD